MTRLATPKQKEEKEHKDYEQPIKRHGGILLQIDVGYANRGGIPVCNSIAKALGSEEVFGGFNSTGGFI